MKNIFILVLFILAIQTINAQQNAADSLKNIDALALNQHKIDSLQTLLSAQTRNDSNKIDRLFLLSEAYFFNMQYAQGLTVAEDARSLSDNINYSKGKALYLSAMAKFHKNATLGFYYGNAADWLYDQNRTLDQLTNFITPDYKLEIIKLKEARLYVEKQRDSLSIVNIDFALMTNYLNLNEDSIAMQYAESPLRVFKQLNEVLPVFEILRRKRNYNERKGNKAAAKELEVQIIKAIAGSNDKKTIALISYGMALDYSNAGRFGLALEFFIKSADALEKLGVEKLTTRVLYLTGETYDLAGLYEKSVEYFERCFELREKTNDMGGIEYEYISITFPLIKLKRFEDVNKYISRARALIDSSKVPIGFTRTYDSDGQSLMAQGRYQEAIQKFNVVLPIWEDRSLYVGCSYFYYYLSQCYQMLGEIKQSLRYAQLSYQRAVQGRWPATQITSSLQISNLYDLIGQVSKAFEYLKIHKKIKDDIQERDDLNRVADIEIQSILEKSQRELDVLETDKKINEEINRNQQLWIFSITGALLSTIFVLLILYRNNRHKQKAKAKIEQAYVDLKSTQAQLVQSEKMASLGELTAGIAHEIQNPLNFVNNFSELNKEMLEELKVERSKLKGQRDEQIENTIIDDIINNEEKINHHGKRAESIVKGMLEHSRSSTGKKELTDINKLADEYLRLAYHGLRAKDKSFNAAFKTDFDEGVGKINIVPQDIGRVILNLITNAFYAVAEKKKNSPDFENAPEIISYEPKVSISTKKLMNTIEIEVTDNGNGIPPNIIDKIFQPFFTTKPTGQGTGLGLSLAYDIVKTYGGELKVETTEGEGSSFRINLPDSN